MKKIASQKTLAMTGGFTLMETLLAITLFAIVVSSSYGVFQMGVQIWKRTTGSVRYENKAFMALEKMQTDIQSTLPVFKIEETILEKTRHMEFSADETSFLFPASVIVEGAKGELNYQYGGQGYAWNSSKQVLCKQVLSAQDFLLRKKPSCKTVLTDVRSANFEYLVGNSVTKSHSWYRDWKGKDQVPRAVRFQIEIAPKDRNKYKPLSFTKTFWVPVSDQPMKDFMPGAETQTPAAA